MRKRNIQKIVRFNRKEAQDLAAKAKKACLSEAGLIRLLIRGYEPKEKPDDRFYDVMRELSSIGNNINLILSILVYTFSQECSTLCCLLLRSIVLLSLNHWR